MVLFEFAPSKSLFRRVTRRLHVPAPEGVLSVAVTSRTNREVRFFADEPRPLARQVCAEISARSDGSR